MAYSLSGGARPHDPELLDLLSKQEIEQCDKIVWRTTRLTQDPTAFSNNGGRWAPPSSYQSVPVLYTSCDRDGALAEMTSWLAQLTPQPTKPILVHQLRVRADQVVTLTEGTLKAAGVDMSDYEARSYAAMGQAPPSRSQDIGAAVSFLGVAGLIVPSARWPCQNMILFDNCDMALTIDVLNVEEVNWLAWREWAQAKHDRVP